MISMPLTARGQRDAQSVRAASSGDVGRRGCQTELQKIHFESSATQSAGGQMRCWKHQQQIRPKASGDGSRRTRAVPPPRGIPKHHGGCTPETPCLPRSPMHTRRGTADCLGGGCPPAQGNRRKSARRWQAARTNRAPSSGDCTSNMAFGIFCHERDCHWRPGYQRDARPAPPFCCTDMR